MPSGPGLKGSPLCFETASPEEVQKYKSEAHKDSQKTANAIKSLMSKKWLEVRNTYSFYL